MARVCGILAGDSGMTEDKMRKDFESWARKTMRSERQLLWLADAGAYENRHTQWEWEAWQEASKTSGRPAAPAWQPIETAPKDGTVVLARIPDSDVQQAVMWSAKEGCWVIQWDHWKLRGLDAPTHWMRLPEVE